MNEKDEFLVRLGGPKQYKKKLDELFRERRLISLEIRELVQDAYDSDPELAGANEELLARRWHKSIFQLSVVFESECHKSPYGMHAVSNAHQHHDHCVWCSAYVGGWENELEVI